jgi:hypothetical protein
MGGFTLITYIITRYLVSVLIRLQSFFDIVSSLKFGKLGSDFLLLNLKKLDGKWKLHLN